MKKHEQQTSRREKMSIFFGGSYFSKLNLYIELIAVIICIPAQAVTFTDGFVRAGKITMPMPTEKADSVEAALVAERSAPVRWQDFSGTSARIDVRKIFPGQNLDRTTVFVAVEQNLSSESNGQITVGSDDGMKLFMNGHSLKTIGGSRACQADTDRVAATFKSGVNRILLRVDNRGGTFEFMLRLVVTPFQAALLERDLQPQTNGKKLPPEQRLNNLQYRYFTAPAAMPRTGPPQVRHAIMSGAHREAHPFYPQYCNGERMPRPDILELRMPLYCYYDARTGQSSGFIASAIQAANATMVPQIEISPFLMNFQATARNPEVAPDIDAFYRTVLHAEPPAMMLDTSGRPASVPPDRSANRCNRYCYSYYDVRNREFTLKTAAAIAALLKKHPEWRTAGINLRYPGSCDWYYPISRECYDYSLPAQAAFRVFLLRKYGSLAALNQAWRTTYREAAEIVPPIPTVGQLNLTISWQDWQEFRAVTVIQVQRELFTAIRAVDPDREIVSWMTTAVSAASRDGIVPDYAMQLSREFSRTLMTLTCFDFYGLPGEIFGQLALAYRVPVAVEPLHCDPASYQKTFYNLLRFPVKKVNWLFYIAGDPMASPWIIWVMNQRGVVDELADAELLQEDTAMLFSWSDVTLQVPTELFGQDYLKSQRDLFRALQSENYNLPLFTDYTPPEYWARHRRILIPGTRLIRPETITSLVRWVQDGGQLTILGPAGEYDLLTGRRDFPLLRRLNADPTVIATVPTKAVWKCGQGQVNYYGYPVEAFIGSNGQLNFQGRQLALDIGLSSPLHPEIPGLAASFVKARGKTRYLGFINLTDGAWTATAEFTQAATYPVLTGREMISGQSVELKHGRFSLSAECPWQVKVIKVELP